MLAHFDDPPGLRCLLDGFQVPFVSLQSADWQAVALLMAAGFCRFKVTRRSAHSLGGVFGDLVSDISFGPKWRSASELLELRELGQLHAARCGADIAAIWGCFDMFQALPGLFHAGSGSSSWTFELRMVQEAQDRPESDSSDRRDGMNTYFITSES